MLSVRPTATTPPSVGAADVLGRNDEVPNVIPPKPWTDELPVCARAAAGATTTRTVARASALRIGHSKRWRECPQQQQCQSFPAEKRQIFSMNGAHRCDEDIAFRAAGGGGLRCPAWGFRRSSVFSATCARRPPPHAANRSSPPSSC